MIRPTLTLMPTLALSLVLSLPLPLALSLAPTPNPSPKPNPSSKPRLGPEFVLGSKMESNDVAKSSHDLAQPRPNQLAANVRVRLRVMV